MDEGVRINRMKHWFPTTQAGTVYLRLPVAREHPDMSQLAILPDELCGFLLGVSKPTINVEGSRSGWWFELLTAD